MKPGLLFFVLFLFLSLGIQGQSRLYLQHQEKSHRQKDIRFKRNYTITTDNRTYRNYRLVSFTDSTITWTAKSDQDTVTVFLDQIQILRKEKKFLVFEITAMFSAIGLMITPLIWATEGGEEALGALEAFGTLLAVTVPVVLIREIGRNKNTRGKWKICTS